MDSNVTSEIKMNDIVTIATLLRDKGDRILNFSCKLTLTIEFLVNLNEAFDLIVDKVESSCFQVINTNNSSIEFLHDLQFLHDFVQKVLGLRLWSNKFVIGSDVTLEKFRSLRILDLCAVHIPNIGICSTRDKLKSLTCTRSSLRDLKILLEPEVSESSDSEDEALDSKRIWLCLEEMFLPHNDIGYLGSSLRYVPNLRILDLSHNNLMDISALDYSSQNLEWLNVSYNSLKKIPTLCHCTKLKMLLVSDNRLEDLKGIANMFSLIHIDASRNLIREHSSLAALMYLPRLERLQLEANPIAFKRGHRLLTIANINSTALASQIFVLDEVPLSSLEKSHFPRKRPIGSKYLGGDVDENRRHLDCSSRSPTTQPSSCVEQEDVTSFKQPLNTRMDLASSSRSVRIREAPISEGEELQLNKSMEKLNEAKFVSASGSAVHLETKRDIESLRRTFGEENWLQGGGGLRILDILGIQADSANFLDSVGSSSSSLPSGCEISQAEVCEEEDAIESKAAVVREGEVDEEEVKEAGEEEEEELLERRNLKQDEGENGVELGVFVVQRKRIKDNLLVMDDLFLILTDRFAIEMNGTKDDLLAYWDLSRLQGTLMEEGGDDPNGTWVHLTFRGSVGTTDKRSYFLDCDEAKELLKILEGILEEKHTSARNSEVQFTCIRCSANFVDSGSLDSNSLEARKNEGERAVVPKCPKCGSAVVVRTVAAEAGHLPSIADIPTNSLAAEVTSKRELAINSEHKSLFANWAGSKLSTSEENNSDALNHGLQLYVMLNVLPDGEGKENEFNIHEALIFQVNSEESFHGHIVLSKDSIYILRETAAGEGNSGERRMSSEEGCEPVLVEWHHLTSCQTITVTYSGYVFQFGPQPPSCVWIYPRRVKQLQKALDDLCNSHTELQYLQNGDQRKESAGGLGEILMALPLVSFSYHSSCDSEMDSDLCTSSKIQPGLLVLTTTAISIMEFKEIKLYISDFGYEPSHTKKVSDLVGLRAALKIRILNVSREMLLSS